jgi:cell division inhibitor SulA
MSASVSQNAADTGAGFHAAIRDAPERSACEHEVVKEIEPPKRVAPHVRMLQIEKDGDRWRGVIKPKIRLMGRWLERAGFKPGNRVQVTSVAPGVIELRSAVASPMIATEQPS